MPARSHFGPRRRVPLPSREKFNPFFFSSASLPDSQPRGRFRHALLQAARRRKGPVPLRRARPPRGRRAQGGRHRRDAGARGQGRAAAAAALFSSCSWSFCCYLPEEDRPDRHSGLRAAPLRPPRSVADLDRYPAGARRVFFFFFVVVVFLFSSEQQQRPFRLRPLGPDALRLRVRPRLSPARGRRRGPQGRAVDAEQRRMRRRRRKRK